MSEETFKITFISGENKDSFYFKHFVDLVYPTLNQLKGKLFSKCGVEDIQQYKNYKIYWIDEDGDEISIIDDDDLRILADRQKSTPIKLNVRSLETENATKATTTTSESSNGAKNVIPDENLPVHAGVICDGCDNGIYGFRYKCIQCHDYDLCRHCESKMSHDHHMMVRIPIGVDRLPRKIDRVLNLGQVFENAEETIRKCRKEEAMFRRQEEKHRREEEKHKRHEEKCKKKAHRRCAREQSRCHASAVPTSEEAQSCDGQNRPGPGILYQVMDYLNYMMNPDNILENLNREQPQSGPHRRPHGCPMMNEFAKPPSCPAFGTDKAQEAKEKTAEASNEAAAAEQEKRSGFENFYENLKSPVATAVPLGTDANVMTTSIGVAAKEVEIKENETKKETPVPEAEKEKEKLKPVEQVLREKLQEKLEQMERDLETDKKNRSTSPTISFASEDSDELNSRDREWTVLENEEPEEAVRDTGAIPKEPKLVEDKATLTDNSSASSMFGSAQGNENPDKEKNATPEKSRGKPLTFEEMSKQLKAHIDEFQKLAVPVGPPANPGQQPNLTPGHYPHPIPAVTTPRQPKVYHPKPHINHAIHTMEAMGFSNDGGWLTSLLDTVDGNIPRALDLLQPHQK